MPPRGSSGPRVAFSGARAWPRDIPSVAALRPDAERLAQRVAASDATPRLAGVLVNRNRRRMLSVHPDGRWFELRVCWRLLPHADAVADAVTHWQRRGAFPSSLQDVIHALEPAPAVSPSGPAKGSTYDLARVLTAARAFVPEFEDTTADVQAVWSRRSTGARTSLRLGSVRAGESVIRVHPTLDRGSVPEYVVHMVVYHELCHVIAPPLSRRDARIAGEPHRIHHRAFRALEARYPHLEEANRWVRDNFSHLAQS